MVRDTLQLLLLVLCHSGFARESSFLFIYQLGSLVNTSLDWGFSTLVGFCGFFLTVSAKSSCSLPPLGAGRSFPPTNFARSLFLLVWAEHQATPSQPLTVNFGVHGRYSTVHYLFHYSLFISLFIISHLVAELWPLSSSPFPFRGCTTTLPLWYFPLSSFKPNAEKKNLI